MTNVAAESASAPDHPTGAAATNDPRPGLAIIANSHTPYRLHLHRRIARDARRDRRERLDWILREPEFAPLDIELT